MSQINIADYQKLLFSNNLNDKDNLDIIKNSKYDFVVFFTKSEGPDGSPIRNIWYDGERLTRFVGIDPRYSTITIGDKIFNLSFDYTTGLLGLRDINKLSAICVVRLEYEGFGNSTYTIDYSTGGSLTGAISSVDNTFYLYVQLILDNPTNSELINVENISHEIELRVNNQYQDNISISLVGLSDNPNDVVTQNSAVYKYKCNIIKDTYKLNNTLFYNVLSTYDVSQSTTTDLVASLNPIKIEVKDNSNNIITNVRMSGVIQQQEATYVCHISPNINNSFPESYDKRKLYLRVNSSNSDAVLIKSITGEGRTTYDYEIKSNKQQIEFIVKPQAINASQSSNITVSVIDAAKEQIYGSNCRCTFDFVVSGIINNNYFYYGYNDPTSSDFNAELEMKDYSQIRYPSELLYDWLDSTKGGQLADSDQYFYFAIPYSETEHIKLKWDAYQLNDNSIKIYNDIEIGLGENYKFSIYTDNKILLGNRYIIYRSNEFGKFNGKLQKDN